MTTYSQINAFCERHWFALGLAFVFVFAFAVALKEQSESDKDAATECCCSEVMK